VDARNRQERTWRQIAAVINDPSLRPMTLEGDLETVPRLDLDKALETIYAESPELRAASIDVSRSETALARERKEPIPDLLVSGGIRYNRELLDNAGLSRPVGREGFFDIGVQLPIFNRNQGNIAAAKATVDKARLEVERTKLSLRVRLAEVYRDYATSLQRADRYQREVLPKAQRAYELYLNNFRQMAAAYPQALIAQRTLFQLQDGYIDALTTVWQRSVDIQGLLLFGGLELADPGVQPTQMSVPGGDSGKP
jgi:cobalt-zinc-cadmium efflux system outer membrane protein